MITEKEGELEVRWWEESLLPDMLDCLRACYPLEKWTVQDLKAFVDRAGVRKNMLKALVNQERTVYGVMLYSLDKDETCYIRRVAVWPDCRKQGFGAFMLNTLTGRRSKYSKRTFVARVLEGNVAAQLFFKKKMGFIFDPKAERTTTAASEKTRDQPVQDYYVFTLNKK